jgi:hypothetical protein
MVVVQRVHQAFKVLVPDHVGAVVTQVSEDFANVIAPAQFGSAESAYERVLAEGDELHGEGFVTCAHVESLKGGVGESRDFNSELEEGLETVEQKASRCGSEVEGSNLSEKRARGIVIIGYQFCKEL